MTKFKDSSIAQTLKKQEYNIFLILSALLGLAPLSWFHGKLIAGEEFYALNYAKWIGIFGKAWSPYLNYGEATILIPLKVQGLFFFVLDYIGLSLYTAQLVWYVFLWVTTAIVFYLFLNKVFEKTLPAPALFVATIYYVYNPFFLNISPFLTPPRLVFIALPIILSILYSIFKQNKVLPKEMFNFALVIFFVSPIFVNLPAGTVIILLAVLGLAYKYLLLDKNYKNFLISSAYLGAFCAIVSLWWLIPVAHETLLATDSIKTTAASFTAVASSRINDVLSQFGSWAFREKIYGYDYYYFLYYKFYDTFPLVLLRYIPYMFVVLGAFFLILTVKTKKDLSTREEYLIFILLIFCIFTFLSKGASGILGGVYEFMYLHLPFFWVFREPYAKFMPIVSVTSVPLILLGYIYISKLLIRIKNVNAVILISLGICFIAIGYPIWNGSVLWRINDRDVRSYEIEAPNYWKEFLASWKPESGYYLLFPSNGMTDRYMWPSGYIGNPYLLFTDARTINPISSYVLNADSQRVIRYIYNKVFQDPRWILSNAERYNLSGLIFQGDTSYLLTEKRKFIGDNYKNLASATFGKIDLYNFIPQDKKLTDFSVIPENKLFWINEATKENYTFLRTIAPESSYFVFGDDSQKYNSYVVTEDKKNSIADSVSETFALKDVKKDSYVGFIEDTYNFIYETNADAVPLNTTSANGAHTFELTLDSKCCSYINLKVKPPVEVSVEKDWTLLQRVDSQHMGQGLIEGTTLDLNTTAKAYYKKLENYDPYMEHIVTLQGKYIGKNGFNIFVVQRDVDILNENPLSGGVIPELNGQISFTLSKADILDTSRNSEYYVVIRKPEPTGGGTARDVASGDSLDLTALRIFTGYHPNILLVKKDSFINLESGAVTSAQQKKVDDTIILTKVPETAMGSYLQFKNAYNKGWRLVTLTEQDWLQADGRSFVSQTLLRAKIGLKALSGKEPVNIEYYSNAWKLDTPNQVYAVVFVQEVKVKALFILAILVVLAGLIKKKW